MQHHRSRFRQRTLFLFLPLLVFMTGFLLFGSNFAVEAQASDASNACAITPELLDGQGRYSVAGLGRYSVAGLGRYSVAGLGRYSVAGLSGFTEEQVEALINEIVNNPISASWIQDPYNLISVGAGFNSGKVALLVIDDFSVVDGDVPAHGGQVRQVIDDLLATLPDLNIDVFNVNIGDGNNNYRMDAIASTVEALITDLRNNQGYEHFVLNMSFGIVPCSDPTTGFDFDDFVAEREASAQPQPITPIVECVINYGEGYGVFFSYQNDNPFVVQIPVGENNAVTVDYGDYYYDESYEEEDPLDYGQPTIFQPGLNQYAFYVDTWAAITWTIEFPDGSVQSVTANEDAPDCDETFLEPAYKVSPVLECVADNQDGTYTAYFGYNNPNAGPVYIEVGGNNRFNPNPRDRGQPRYFAPGRHQFVFEVTFTSGNLVWTLRTPGFSASTSTAGTGAATIECNPLAKQTGSQYGLLQYLVEVLGLDLDDALAYLNTLLTGSQFTGVHDDGTVPTLGGLRELLQQYLAESANPNSNFALFAIASSGNYGDLLTDPLAPARWAETIAVSALLGNNGLWPFSQLGNIAAPGAWYPFNFDDDDDIELYGAGTSYSAPFLSLVAALWMTYEDKDVCNFTATFPPLRNPGQLGNRDYTELDCEVPLNGTVVVRKFHDLNNNGTRQNSEKWLSGWSFTLSNDDESFNGVTDNDGRITFADVPVGEYQLCETVFEGWQPQSGNACVTVSVESGETTELRFANVLRPERQRAEVCVPFEFTSGQNVENSLIGGLIEVDTVSEGAIYVASGESPFGWESTPNNLPGGIQDATRVHGYTFTFAPDIAVSAFSVRVVDYGDYNPARATLWGLKLEGFGTGVGASDGLVFTTAANSTLGNIGNSTAAAGLPGNRLYAVAGTELTSAALSFTQNGNPNYRASNVGNVVGATSADPHIGLSELCITYEELTGSLSVTKEVETFGFEVEQDFEICIDSDEIDAPLCRDFNSANGFTQTFEDIPAGSYLITETSPGASWTVGGDNGVSVDVTAGETASATLSNTYNPPDSQICAAVEVINFSQGPARVGNPSADRSNSANALGAPQNTDAPPVNFVSLGFGGSITLRLTGAVYNNAGSDLFVVETSYGSPSCSSYPEKANVEVSQDGVTYYAITAGTPNLCVDGGVDITNSGDLPWIQYIRITDVSNPANFSNNQSSDGFDVDGILCDAPIRPGSIKVIKYNDANGNGRKDSGEGGLSGWSFTVNGVTQTTGSNGQTVFSNLAPGNYQVCEMLREGWTNTDPSNGSGCKTVTVREGRQTEVKIGNRQNPPATGSITIIKDVVTTGSTSTEFFFEVRQGVTTIADGIELGDGASETVDNLPAGTYTVEELFGSFGSGFSFGGAVCTNGDEEVSIPADVTGNNTKIDVEVGVGEDWTCTFTNYDRPSLVIYKQTDLDGDTTLFTFNQNVRPSLPPTFTLADDDFQQYFEFGAGVFTVTEDTQSGWLLDDVICTGATGVVDVAGGVEITFDWGDTVTCTFYNVADPVETGSITITKTVISEGNPTTEFPYEVLQGDTVIEDNIDVAGGGSHLVDNLTPGTYIVDELFEVGYGSGWVFGGAVCTNGDEEVSIPRDDSGNASEITVEVGEGEDWTCEFTNYAKSALRIEKQTDVDGDPTVFVFDLTGFVIPTINLADNGSEFRPELKGDVTYTIVEQPQAGWTLDSVVCTGGTVTEIENGIEIVLGWGVSLKCTFNNVQAEDNTRTITIQKNSAEPGYDAQVYFDGDLPDVNGGNPGDFSTNGMGGLYTFENLEPGIYTVTELVPDGWDLASVTCNGESLTITNNSVEIDATEADRTCTFNNVPESLQSDEGSITIVKQTVYNSSYGSASDTTFFFGGDLGAFDLITGESEPFTSQAAGTYVVTESVAQGWDLTGLSCLGDTDNGSAVDLNQQKATIDLDDGENIICTFTNTRLTGTLTFVKDFVGEAVPNVAWQFTLNGANFTTINGEGSSATFTLPTDMYTVGEVVPQGYDLTSIQCGDAGQISDPAGDDFELLVLSGQNVTCTFTNEAEDTPPPPYEEPELFCPAGYTQFNLVTHGALLTQQYNQSYAGEFWLPEDSDGFLRVWSKVGYPEEGCPDSGSPLCGDQDGESFFVNIANQQFFVPDHGNNQWQMFDFDLDLTRNMWQYSMDHSFQATNNEFGSVNFNAVYCAQPAEIIIEEPVDEPVEEPVDESTEEPAPENHNPSLSVINLFSFVGEQIDLTIGGQDEDNDTLSFSFSGLPSGLNFDGATGHIYGVIGAVNETTNFTVEVTVSDGKGGTATSSFIWTVQPVAAPPVSNLINTEGDVINVMLPALNYPGLTLTFDYTGLPTGLTFDPTTGSVSGTAPQVDSDTVFNVTLTVTVSAPGEGSASAVVNFTWTILNVPDAGLTSLEAVPVEQPPVEQPPVEQPPVEQPPVEQPPVEQPPAESTESAEGA